MAIERAADDLEFRRRRLPPTTAVGAQLGPVVDWLRHQRDDVRRRAVLAGAASKGWRHPSTFDHIRGLGRAAARGLGDGVVDLVRGGGGLVRLTWYTATDPRKAIQMGVATVGQTIRSDPMQLQRGLTYGRDLWTEGFWPATEDYVHDTFEQVPSAALSSVGGVRGAAVPRVASNASYLSALAPAPPTLGAMPRLLRLSVPTGDGATRVALDPADGRFVVFTEETAVRRTGWRGLEGDERAALKAAGIVDRKGHLREDDDQDDD